MASDDDPPTPRSNADRDAAIIGLFETGYRQADIARAHGLSRERVRQILREHDVAPRSPCIPPLVWYDELPTA